MKIVPLKWLLLFLALLLPLLACNMPTTELVPAHPSFKSSSTNLGTPEQSDPGHVYLGTPTPNPPKQLPDYQTNTQIHVVQINETLGSIAQKYGLPLETLLERNQLLNPNLLSVGQQLIIPAPQLGEPALAFKIIPDSELVFGPGAIDFDLRQTIEKYDGQLKIYQEEVDGITLDGADVIELVAVQYSVHPRLLLALLDYQSNWLQSKTVNLTNLSFPMGFQDARWSGLYKQLAWAADILNEGFYGWQGNKISGFTSQDRVYHPANPGVNAGTAAVQHFFAKLHDQKAWLDAISDSGFYSFYNSLFGNPFAFTHDPMMPEAITQPLLQLPFEPGIHWNFTGGPHAGWDDGSPWAAVDFAPQMAVLGCHPNSAWVTAMSSGQIVYAQQGMVIQDLDLDGKLQTGWSLIYMHIDSSERVQLGSHLAAGDRIGHPSCEGGYSTGTHVHIARRYNGLWVEADGDTPLIMDGWIAEKGQYQYDGRLINGNLVVEPCECQETINLIFRDQ